MFKPTKNKAAILGLAMTLIYFGACEYENFPEPTPPRQPQETLTLEASYSASPPLSIKHTYWEKADYRTIALQDISTGNMYDDGYLNLTGTFNGMSDFNGGVTQPLTMKAAYDQERLYVLLEWYDDDIDVSAESWLFDGPKDSNKSDATDGWTSQRGADMLSLAFDLNGGTSAAGTFTDVGCAASCHNNSMKPQSGSVDIWKWSLALSDPLGYAIDMVADGTNGLTSDGGDEMAIRNSEGVTGRSGPKFQWDGNSQAYTRPDGKPTLLDPAFFLLNTEPVIGDPVLGNIAYKAECASCHGENAEGGDGSRFNVPGGMNRFSQSSFDQYAASDDHSGKTYYMSLNSAAKLDVFSRIKGYSGYHGYYLQTPSGSNADIWAVSNVSHVSINLSTPRTVYKVLLVRDLITDNADDAQFETPSGKSFTYGVALMDNDGINHVGSVKEVLTFNSN
jgi:Ethylbenzene dehydrogenase